MTTRGSRRKGIIHEKLSSSQAGIVGRFYVALERHEFYFYYDSTAVFAIALCESVTRVQLNYDFDLPLFQALLSPLMRASRNAPVFEGNTRAVIKCTAKCTERTVDLQHDC